MNSAVRRLTYQPALDGVRAVAVTMVLFFHAGFGWMGGGYVGVSVFFTLSGFLITSLLVAEHAETGGVALRTVSYTHPEPTRLLSNSYAVFCLKKKYNTT